jgi:hypothetical protein
MAQQMPHDEVFVRLGVSKIHGVGVFAHRPIKAGTNVFANDRREITWVQRAAAQETELSEFQRSLYNDFAIRRGDQLGCPSNFNLMSVGWYVNEPADGQQANLTSTSEFDLVAVRDIEIGEELTLSYSSFQAGAQV